MDLNKIIMIKFYYFLTVSVFLSGCCSCPHIVKLHHSFGGDHPYCDEKHPGKNVIGDYDYEVCGPSKDD